MSKMRKSLTFDSSDQSENTAYIFLEKIRYQQTKFITKLIMDFMRENEVDINGPYEELKKACRQYIYDKEISTPFIVQGKRLKEIEDSINEIKELLMESTSQKVQSEPSELPEPVKEDEAVMEEQKQDDELSSMLSSFKMMADA